MMGSLFEKVPGTLALQVGVIVISFVLVVVFLIMGRGQEPKPVANTGTATVTSSTPPGTVPQLPATGTSTATTPDNGPVIPTYTGPPLVLKKTIAEIELEMLQQLEVKLDTRDYEAAFDIYRKLIDTFEPGEERDALVTEHLGLTGIIEAGKLEKSGRTKKALRILWPLAADSTRPWWQEPARTAIERINSSAAKAGTLYRQAKSKIKQGKSEDARRLLKKIIADYPLSPEAKLARQALDGE